MPEDSLTSQEHFTVLVQRPSFAYLRLKAVCLDHARSVPSSKHNVKYEIAPPSLLNSDIKVALSRLRQHSVFQRLPLEYQQSVIQNLVWLMNDRYMGGWEDSPIKDMLQYALQETGFPREELTRAHVLRVGRYSVSDNEFSEGLLFPPDMFRARNFLPVGMTALLINEIGVVGFVHTTHTTRTLTIIPTTIDNDELNLCFSKLEHKFGELASLPENDREAQYEDIRKELAFLYIDYRVKSLSTLGRILRDHMLGRQNLALLRDEVSLKMKKKLADIFYNYQGNLADMRKRYQSEADYLALAQILRLVPEYAGKFSQTTLIKESELFSEIQWQSVYDVMAMAQSDRFNKDVHFAVITTKRQISQ